MVPRLGDCRLVSVPTSGFYGCVIVERVSGTQKWGGGVLVSQLQGGNSSKRREISTLSPVHGLMSIEHIGG